MSYVENQKDEESNCQLTTGVVGVLVTLLLLGEDSMMKMTYKRVYLGSWFQRDTVHHGGKASWQEQVLANHPASTLSPSPATHFLH